MEAFITLLRLHDRLVVHPNSKTKPGFYIGTEPCFVLSRSASPDELGAASFEARNACRTEVEPPKDFKLPLKPLLTAAHARSWLQIQRQSQMCSVWVKEQSIELYPTHNGGTRGDTKGFHDLREQRLVLPRSASPRELGEAVLSCFDRCTSVYSSQ